MAFEPITTQEALDNIISERLKREREKFSDYDSLKGKVSDYEKQVGELNKQFETLTAQGNEMKKENETLKATIQKYETDSVKTRLVLEAGLPYGATQFITGGNEEEIKGSITNFLSITKTTTPPAPLANPEPVITKEGQANAANKALLSKLKGE